MFGLFLTSAKTLICEILRSLLLDLLPTLSPTLSPTSLILLNRIVTIILFSLTLIDSFQYLLTMVGILLPVFSPICNA